VLEKWTVIFSDNFALNDIDIYCPHRGPILIVATTKKNTIDISRHMYRQWIGGVGDQLWMLTTYLRDIKLT
jgi:hypothetical protein